ncbi:MAG: glycosyltransferase family 2 protein [Campylobacterota bacterium]
MPDTAVVIPTYNNQQTIQDIVDSVLSRGMQPIVVDDGSTPAVQNVLNADETVVTVRHAHNRGKGQAIVSGAKKAKELGYTQFVSMDADGQHLAAEIDKLLQAQTSQGCIVIGVRNFAIENIPIKSKLGKYVHNVCIYLNSGFKIKDSLSGFRLYPVDILRLPLRQKGFDFEIEVLMKHLYRQGAVTQTSVACYYPLPQERVSHFDNYKDTIALFKLHGRFFLRKITGYKEG